MVDSTSQRQGETENNAGHAIPTLPIAIPITLTGKDANGVDFAERARTIVIDRHGGKIATKRNLSPGSEMILHNPIVGQTARIRVVRVGEKRAGEEAYEVGIQFLGSENIWGIAFPFPDQQEDGPQAPGLNIHSSRMAAAASSAGPSAVLKSSVPDAASSRRNAKSSSPAPSVVAASLQAAQPSPLPVAVPTPARPVEEAHARIEATRARLNMQRIETAGEDEPRLLLEMAEEEIGSSSLPGQPNAPDIAEKFEGREGSIAEHVMRPESGLQACRSEMQQLVAELEQLKHAVQGEMGETLRQVKESRPRLVELAISDLEMKVKEGIDLVAEELIDLTQKRVKEEVTTALEPLVQGAVERVRSAAEEQSVRAGEGIQGVLRCLIQEGQEQFAHMLRSTTSEFQKELNHISATNIASAQAEIAQAWSKSAAGFETRIQETADQVAESAAKQLQKQAEDALMPLGKVKEGIDLVAEELIDLTPKRVEEEVTTALEPLVQGAVERVRSAAEEQSVRAGEGIQGVLRCLVQEGQEQFAHMLRSTTSEFQKELNHISATNIASAQAEIAQAWSKSAAGFETRIQETADQVAESAAKQLQKQAEDTSLLLGEELRNSGNDYIKKLEESLTKAEGAQQRWAQSSFRKALEQENAEALARMKCDLAQALEDITGQAARQASALHGLRKAVEEESLQTLANVKAAATQAIGEVSSQIERQVNALKELCGEVREESAKTLAQAKREAVQVLREVSERAGRDVEALNNLRNSLVEESAQPLAKFRQDLEQVMGEAAEQVQQQVNMLCSLPSLVEKESARVFSQVKNDITQALAGSSLLAEHHMKSIQAALSEWETQISSQLESRLRELEGKSQASQEALQERSEELLKSTGEKLRQESQALVEQVEASLNKAAGDIEQNWLERIRGKQRWAADEIIETATAQLGKQLEESLDFFSQGLKVKQEQAASDAAEALRNKIVEMLTVSQSPRSSLAP